MPRPQVVRLAKRAAGRPVEMSRRIVRGYDNEVYRIGLSGGHVVYVRIRRQGEGSFDQEAWAMSLAREAGVPVPEVLAVDTVSDAEGRHPAMVVADATGHQLEASMGTLSDPQRRRVLVDLGTVLARLHSIAVLGVWRPDESGRWPDPDELRRGFIAERKTERGLLLAAGLSGPEVDRVIDLLDYSPDTPPRSNFVLCHGDISPEHVFVCDDLQVSGLID